MTAATPLPISPFKGEEPLSQSPPKIPKGMKHHDIDKKI
jgi:hypothetical protein